MKFKSLLFAACALGMMASCTDKDDIVNPDDGFDPNGEGYVCFTLNLPVSAGTRAENDDFDDGIASEYAVQDATLVLFEGDASSTEYTATLASAYDLSASWSKFDDDPNQITVTSQIVQKVNNPTASTNKFYAYIILNHPVNVYVKDKTLVNNSSGTEVTLTGKTYTELRKILVNDVTDAINSTDIVAGKKFITMTNAPLAKYTGSSSAKPAYDTITVMPAIVPSKIKATEAAAQADPACEVYVERILAKVTLRTNMANLVTSSGNTESDKLAFTFVGWQLDNTSKESFLGRNLGEKVESSTGTVNGHDLWYIYHSNKIEDEATKVQQFRFTGLNKVNKNETVAAGYDLYRTYWCIDPSYDTTFDLGNEDTETATAAKTNWDKALRHEVTAETTTGWNEVGTTSTAIPQYCYENTFDVAHQHERYTTRAIVKAKFNGGTTFYTVSNNGSNLLSNANMIKAVKSAALSDGAILSQLATNSITTSEGRVSVTMDPETSSKAGTQLVTAITITDNNDGSKSYTCTDEDLSRLNKLLKVQQYLGGMAYYRVLIKHFGDDLTPWNSAEHLSSSAYADNAAGDAVVTGATIDRYLGRYGVVRNNWYDITVTDIKALGEATVPDVTNNDTDDKVESYIAVKINILSWAKRTQNVVL